MMSVVKRVSLLSLIAALCVSPVLAKKQVKKAAPQTRGFSSHCNTSRKGACDADFEKFKNCIEKLLCEKFRKLDCDLDKELSELNENLSCKVESLNICLKEFIAKQIKEEEERLKCWFTCRLDKTEHDLEEFICHKFDCLIDFLCCKFKEVDCDLAVLTCKVDDVNTDVNAISATLCAFFQNQYNETLSRCGSGEECLASLNALFSGVTGPVCSLTGADCSTGALSGVCGETCATAPW
ncbi:MAG: hypothetical protein NT124_00690 [Candidatus Dependentiae bacterium]|nr:hypothetical protein [Candidatus Dependentiae bacterium]